MIFDLLLVDLLDLLRGMITDFFLKGCKNRDNGVCVSRLIVDSLVTSRPF